jgi:hypothetical protein
MRLNLPRCSVRSGFAMRGFAGNPSCFREMRAPNSSGSGNLGGTR